MPQKASISKGGSPRRRIGLAVSGGADSTALLVLMAELQDLHAFDAVVLHVDHGLRKNSAEDAQFVRKLAKDFNCRSAQFAQRSFEDRGNQSKWPRVGSVWTSSPT